MIIRHMSFKPLQTDIFKTFNPYKKVNMYSVPALVFEPMIVNVDIVVFFVSKMNKQLKQIENSLKNEKRIYFLTLQNDETSHAYHRNIQQLNNQKTFKIYNSINVVTIAC